MYHDGEQELTEIIFESFCYSCTGSLTNTVQYNRQQYNKAFINMYLLAITYNPYKYVMVYLYY